VVVTIAADRSSPGRTRRPAVYARETLRSIPGFRGRIEPGAPPVDGSPYASAVVRGAGRLPASRTPQLITVAAFHRPERGTYAAVVFANGRVRVGSDDRIVRRMLRTFRARAPDLG
jgi:hypothetical protein